MFGAVVFDDPQRPSGGWRSVQGQPAQRLRAASDLEPEICWWHNLDLETFMKYGLSRASMTRADYLRPDMAQLQQELGLSGGQVPGARVAEICAEVFDRVMRLAGQHYGLYGPTEDTLAEDLYAKLLRSDSAMAPELHEALAHAFQPYSRCEVDIPADATITPFRRPRILHAIDVLKTPIPGGQWEYVDETAMPPEDKRLAWVINQSRPALVRVSVRQIASDVAKIIAFHGGRERNWVSHPELLSLSRFGKVHIHGAFLASEYEPEPVCKPMFTGGAIGMLSVSLGILCENYWGALASPYKPNKRSTESVVILSPRAVWLSACDRFHMLMAALLMHGSGFVVRGYGRGGVNVAVPRGLEPEARACAAAAGLDVPLNAPKPDAGRAQVT